MLAILVFASLMVLPAFAENIEIKNPKFSYDFEDLEPTDDRFMDEDKPEGFPFFVGGAAGGGATIVDNAVGGSVSVNLFRKAGGPESTSLRIGQIDTVYAEDTEYVGVQFAFRIEKIGDYGFTAIIGNTGVDIESWEPNFLSVKKKDGQIVINGFDHREETLAKSGLEANRDYVVTAVFELGTKNYDLYLDGEKIGSFENGIGKTDLALQCIDVFRIDHHGMDEPENLVDIVYFDDIKIGEVTFGSDETPSDPTDPTTPNTPTGDTMPLVIVVAMAVILAAVLLRKRVNG